MATTQRSGLSMVVETPREEAAFEKAVASRKALEEALKARENPLFDPVLLAMAQGFLAPTKTGSFGEALGNVAAMVGPAQASEDKRAIEMAQIRRELAAQELAEAQAISEQQMLRGLPSIFGPSGGAPAGQPAPGGRPAPAGQAAQAAPSGEVTTTNPNEVLSYVERLSRSSRPALQNAAKQTLELLKFEREGVEIRDGIVINKNRRDASGAPMILADLRQKQEPTEIVYQGRAMSIPMTGLEIQQFKAEKEKGPEAERRYFETYLAGRRSGPQAMPFGGERKPFSIGVPDPNNPGKLLTMIGEGTDRQRAMLEQAEERAFETGDFSELMRLYTQVTKQGAYTPPSRTAAPAAQPARTPAAPAAAPGAPAAAPSVPPERAEAPPPTQEQNALMDQLRQASNRMASAVQANDANAERQARVEINNLRQQLATSQGIPVGLAVDPELAGLPIAEQVKITTDRIKANDKEATEQMGLIRQIGAPQQVVASNRRLEEIRRLVREHPDAVGLLVRQGLMNALMAAANEGFSFGSYRASAPVTTFLEKVKLPEPKQDVARRVVMLLDEEFFNRAAAYKSVLGPQISNADSVMMKSPSARPQDSARVIAYWATHSLLTNRQIDDMYNAAREYPKNRSPNNFIGEDVRRIMDSYTPLFTRIQSDFTAGR
jgi:hypothetical protein